MIREAIATGDTVEEAFENACKELNVEPHEAEFEILKLPVRKTLGLFGGNPATVKAFIKSGPAEAAAEYLKTVLSAMGIETVGVKITEEENGAMISLDVEDVGFLIGHRGETLDALQYLSGLVANHVENSYYRVMLDVGNYREKRKETLEALGKKMAEKAVKNKRNFSLEPMNPYERRIIHTAVQTVEGAKSWSEGEEIGRHVVVGPEGGEVNPPRFDRNRHSRPQQRRPGVPSHREHRDFDAGKAQTAQKPIDKKPNTDVTTPLYGKIDIKK